MKMNSKSTYSFNVVPEQNWIFQLDKKVGEKGVRLMGRGNIFTDVVFSNYVDNKYGNDVSTLLQRLIKKYGINETPVVLVEPNRDGFRFVKGELAYMIDTFSRLLQQLLDSYQTRK